jgi:antitoxin (DNA-binding transcriptional repressor) of toxin-antitoxin stability system
MKNLTIRQARQSLSHLEDILSSGEEVTITKRGKAVARIVRLGVRKPIPSHRDLRAKMRRMRKESAGLIREDRDSR